MKKRFICLIGVLLIFSLLLTGCNDLAETQPNTPEETPEETPVETPEETPIETPDETSVDKVPDETPKDELVEEVLPIKVKNAMVYFGNYDGVLVLDMAKPNAADKVYAENVAGYEFVNSVSDPMDVYSVKYDELYTISRAYELNLLSSNEIKDIHEKYVKLYQTGDNAQKITVAEDGYYYVDGENIGVKAGVTDGGRAYAVSDAKNRFGQDIAPSAETPEAIGLPDDVQNSMYYGEFNGVHVIDLHNAKMIDSEEIERIGDYCFIYPDADFMDAYDEKSGKYYDLKEAYEKGLLSESDIKAVNELFKKAYAFIYDEENRPTSRIVWPLDGIGTSGRYVDFSYTIIGKYDYNPYYKVTVAGYEFNLLGDEKIVISYNREKYTLNEAYDAKIITDEDVKLIHQRWVERYDGTY